MLLSCMALSAQKVINHKSSEYAQSYIGYEFKELNCDKYREGECRWKTSFEYISKLKAILKEVYEETIYPKIGNIDNKLILLVFDENDDFIKIELMFPCHDCTDELPTYLMKDFALKVKERVVPSDYFNLYPRVPGYTSYYKFGVITRHTHSLPSKAL